MVDAVGGLAGEAYMAAAGAVVGLAAGGPGGAVLGGGAGAVAGIPLSFVTAAVGSGVGGYLGYRFCSDDDACDEADSKPGSPITDDDTERRCDKQYYEVDIPTCNGISRMRGKKAGARCFKSATARYGACLAGLPLPPLDTWNN